MMLHFGYLVGFGWLADSLPIAVGPSSYCHLTAINPSRSNPTKQHGDECPDVGCDRPAEKERLAHRSVRRLKLVGIERRMKLALGKFPSHSRESSLRTCLRVSVDVNIFICSYIVTAEQVVSGDK